MPTVNATSTFGQSRWVGHADVTDEQFAILANRGFLWTMQRTPSSNAEKEIAGYEKRPDGFKRGSMTFDERFQSILKKNIETAVAIDDEGEIEISPKCDSIKFHEIGAGVEPKYADEKKAVQRHIDAGDVSDWNVSKVGYEGRDLTVDNVEFLKAVKAFKQRLLAESL